jgi:hypothetical protein
MKRIYFVLPLLGSLLLGTAVSGQDSNDIQFISTNVDLLNDRIAELEIRLASAELTEFGSVGAAQNGGCKSGKCGKGGSKSGGGCWCIPGAGIVFEAELLLLRMADSDGSVQQDAVATGSRFTLGYITEGGHSLRLRWFEYANSEDGLGDEFVVETLDIEYAGRFTLGCNWRGELSVGGRWADVFWDEGADDYQDAFGPVAGVSLRGDLFRSLDIYANARQSYMFGRNLEDSGEYQSFAISELGFGVEASREVRSAMTFLRAGVEAQYYHSVADNDEDVGLIGAVLAAGITR